MRRLKKSKSSLKSLLSLCDCDYEEQQKLAVRFNTPLRYENAISQLQGIAYAVTFDNELSKGELKLLVAWLNHNEEFLGAWPISTVYNLFIKALEHGKITEEIKQKLLNLLLNVGGSDTVAGAIFDKLTEEDCFKDDAFAKCFVVTGVFDSGHARSEIWEMISQRGGFVKNTIAGGVDYLIVGEKGSKAWRFGKFGRKIESAIYLREDFGTLKIIKEKDFFQFLDMYPDVDGNI